jgi:NADH dehydrogenase FAD-containing subunit
MTTPDTLSVLVVGGGYGGITVAKALDDVADVTVIEPRDTFVHHVAALRAVVDPEWVERIFLPFVALADFTRAAGGLPKLCDRTGDPCLMSRRISCKST